MIERDNFRAPRPLFKKIYMVDLDDVGRRWLSREARGRRPAADRRSAQHRRLRAVFRFPFQTIESVIPLSNTTLGVLDDNNYPFSNGRVAGQPDPNEFIVIRLDRPLVRRPKHGHRDHDWWDDDQIAEIDTERRAICFRLPFCCCRTGTRRS